MAAPDPKNPDLVFGSKRTGVSLYNRQDGSDGRRSGPPAETSAAAFGRNVRTMPIVWSPVDSNVLFYAQNAVWKTIEQRPQLDAHQRRSHAADVGRARERRQVRAAA